jgi:hypothetical protein
MEQAEVVRKARDLARAREWDLAQFEEPKAELKDTTWYVRFEGRKRAPGNHFVVQVDDTSGEAVLWPGR